MQDFSNKIPTGFSKSKGYTRHAREAWTHSINCSKAVHAELQAYRAQVNTHEIQIQTRDTRIGSLETLVATLVAQTSSLQTQLTASLGCIQALKARDPEPQDGPADAGSSFADALAEIEANGTSRNDDDSHDSGTGIRRQVPVACECTYTDFLKCQPLNFKGIEGVVGLTQWFKKMESVFHIRNYTVACQIKFATCTLQGNALTWWNSHVRTVGHDVAYAMTWKTLMKMITGKYCPRGEIKKLEIELWNLKVKESDEVEKYVGGLPDMIQGSVMASKPKKMQDAIEFATELMDQKICTLAERQAENKRKFEGLGKRNRTKELNLCALNATTIMMDSVLPSAPTVRGLAISPGTVKASLLLPTTREPKGTFGREKSKEMK
ncbi:reverse transcriptase domain-containing protein [Tanacetum coccineum]